jgi:hypothetical protein
VSRSESTAPLFLHPTHSTISCHLWDFGTYFVCAAALTSPVGSQFTTYIRVAHRIPSWAPSNGIVWRSLFDLSHLPFVGDALFCCEGVSPGCLSLITLPPLLSRLFVQAMGVVAAYNFLIPLYQASAGSASFPVVHYLTKAGRAACVSGPLLTHPRHPERMQDGWPQSRRHERERELAALLLPRIKALVKTRGITLIRYLESKHQARATTPPGRHV